MSFELQLLQLTGISKDRCTISVQGSEAGELIVHKKSMSYRVKCNRLNLLKFTIKIEPSNEESKGGLLQAEFAPQRFLKENKANPDLYKETQIHYDINIFDQQQKVVGVLKFGIIYVKGQLFMGQKFGNFETLPQKQPVKVFEGVCQTRNLFSFLDSGTQDRNFHFIENNYRDGTFD